MWLGKTAHLLGWVANPVSRVLNSGGLIVLAVMVFFTASDVTLRYLFNRPILGSWELTELMLALLVFSTIAYTAVKKGHINVELVTSRLPPRAREIIESITLLLSTVLFALMAWQSAVQAVILLASGSRSEAYGVPHYPFFFVVAFGSGLLSLVLLVDLLNSLARLIERNRWGILIWLVLGGIVSASPIWIDGLPWEVSPLMAGLIGMGILLILLFSGMPIGFGMAFIGILGMAYISGTEAGLGLLRRVPYGTTATYALSVVPLFIVMGEFAYHSGLSRELYYTVYRWIGHLPGGLAMATVGACAGFAAVSGSSLATAATMGTVALPEMRRYKYDDRLATGCVAAGGTIGSLIPPSTVMIIYGIMTEQSIGRLFIAGFIPGVLEAIFYMITIYVLARLNPVMGPRGERSSYIERVKSLRYSWAVVVLFVVVIGGLYRGVFTPTEAGGVGAFGALLIAVASRRLSRQGFVASLVGAGKTSTMTFAILIGAMIFGYFLTVSRIPFLLAEFISGLAISRHVILAIVLVMYLFLGCVMDALAMIILTIPIFFPLIMSMGFDPIWFGIIMVRVVEMGIITPPVGINVFVIHGVAKDVPLYTIFRGIVPFLMADICHVALLVAFPQIALFLPTLLK